MDGTQARLKLPLRLLGSLSLSTGGKGGWDSGEIETTLAQFAIFFLSSVERVDGTQARLKHCVVTTSQDTIRVERVDGTQARLKRRIPR